MFTVLSNTRSSYLYLVAALVAVVVVLLTFAVAPAIFVSRPSAIPATTSSEASSDYFLRHPELSMSSLSAVDVAGDFYLRHPGWASDIQSLAIPVTGAADAADYFQRHPELLPPDETSDLSDYFLRH